MALDLSAASLDLIPPALLSPPPRDTTMGKSVRRSDTGRSKDLRDMAFPSARHLKSLPPRSPPSTTPTGRRAAEQSYLALLQACESLPGLLQAQAFLLKSSLQVNPLILTKFASTASSLDTIDAATSLLFSPCSTTHLYDDFLFNTIIHSHANSHHPESKQQEIFYYSLMLRSYPLPNKFTFPFLLKACAGLPHPHTIGSQVHASAVKFEFSHDSHVQNTLIHMYSSNTGVDSACKVFDRTPRSSALTWSVIIVGYV